MAYNFKWQRPKTNTIRIASDRIESRVELSRIKSERGKQNKSTICCLRSIGLCSWGDALDGRLRPMGALGIGNRDWRPKTQEEGFVVADAIQFPSHMLRVIKFQLNFSYSTLHRCAVVCNNIN